jgi:hypothetical protein
MKRIILIGLLGIMGASVAEAGAIGRMLFGPRRAGGGGCYGASYAPQAGGGCYGASYASACGSAVANPAVGASGCYGSSYGLSGASYAVPAPMITPAVAPMAIPSMQSSCPGGVCPVGLAPVRLPADRRVRLAEGEAPPTADTERVPTAAVEPVAGMVRRTAERVPTASIDLPGVAIPADPGDGGVAIPLDVPGDGPRLARTRG